MFLWPSKPVQIQDPGSVVGSLVKSPNWIVQLKKNGCRAIVSGENDKVIIYERHGTVLTPSGECNWSPLLNLFQQPFLLDGELVGRKQGEISNRLYLWDVPMEAGVDLTGKPYWERYALLNADWRQDTGKASIPVGVERFLVNDPAGIEVSIAKSYPAEIWLDVMRWTLMKSVEQHLMQKAKERGTSYPTNTNVDLDLVDEDFAKHLRTGEYEGLVFKDIRHHMSWSSRSTREIPQQLKFLYKFATRRKAQLFSDVRKQIWQELTSVSPTGT